MKVVMLGRYPLEDMDVGGVSRHVVGLTQEMAKDARISLHFVTISDKNEELIKNGMRIHTIKGIGLPLSDTLFNVPLIRKKIIEVNPELVHCQGTFTPYSLAAVSVCNRFPTVLTVHGIIAKESRYLWQSRRFRFVYEIIYPEIERFVLSKIPNIIVVSGYGKIAIKRVTRSNIHVIPNGVDNTFFDVTNQEVENRLLFVGLIHPSKGILDLLKAIKEVKKSIPTIRLHIVGPIVDETYFVRLKGYANRNDMARNIVFRGPLIGEDLKKEYGECSIFVLPSKIEIQPIVLLEAMASCKPVIAANVGGIPSKVKNGRTGYLVESGDISALADRIIQLLSNRRRRQDMGSRGREEAKKFSWGDIAQMTIQLYMEATGRRPNKWKNG